MTTRTIKSTVTFRRPFVLASFGEALPAGVYDAETDEELIEGLSFVAYRRTLTVLQLPATPGKGLRQTLSVEPGELDAALARDMTPEASVPVPGDGNTSDADQHGKAI